MAKKGQGKEVVPTQENLPAEMMEDMEQHAGKGAEGADRECFSIPFLTVLQSGSPQCNKADTGAYIKGAEAGMLYNTVTAELIDGDKGVIIIPAAFERAFINWTDRSEGGGGGMLGKYKVGDQILDTMERDDKGRNKLPDGTIMEDTREHGVIICHADERLEPAVLALKSTQIRKSRNLLTQMQNIKFQGKSGPFTPPTFGLQFKLTTVAEQNDKGNWFGVKIEYAGPADAKQYKAGRELHKQLAEGKVQGDYGSVSETPTEVPDEQTDVEAF
jgi:hypothetical protein